LESACHRWGVSTLSSTMSTLSLLLSDEKNNKEEETPDDTPHHTTPTATTTTTTTTTSPRIVVDFGSGSGNLTLPLAAAFPHLLFVLVDQKKHPLAMADERIQQANLSNVATLHYQFTPNNLQDFVDVDLSNVIQTLLLRTNSNHHPNPNRKNAVPLPLPVLQQPLFQLGIGWHCCGSFTDMVLELCLERAGGATALAADCIVCPCCNGGLVSTAHTHTTDYVGYTYPRSAFLKAHMTEPEYLKTLCKAADNLPTAVAGGGTTTTPTAPKPTIQADHETATPTGPGATTAKCLMEYDRAMWAFETKNLKRNNSHNNNKDDDDDDGEPMSSSGDDMDSTSNVKDSSQKSGSHNTSDRGCKMELLTLSPLDCGPKNHVLYLYDE
jgi:hypothetical protein